MNNMKSGLVKLLALIFLIGIIFCPSIVLAVTTIGTNISTAGSLTVGGLLQFTSGAALGSVLASDVSGNASWTALDTSMVAENPLFLYYNPTDVDARADARISLQAGNASGLATLDGTGKVPSGQLPAIAITNVYSVADMAGRTLLETTPGVQSGDVAIVANDGSGSSRSYIWDGLSGNWLELLTPLDLYLARSSNLSDLADKPTARDNLGLGTGANPQFTSLTLSGLAGLTLSSLTPDSFIYSGVGGQITSTAAPTDGQLLIGDSGSAPVLATLSGTSNQIDIINAPGSITLATPQDIHSGASPQFAGLTLSGSSLSINTVSYTWPGTAGSGGQVLTTDGLGGLNWATAGSGEINTASNVGSGTGQFFYQKSAADLQFRGLSVNSNKLSITNGAGDAPVTLDVNEANLTLNNIGGTLGISKGGTGQITKTTAFDALSPLSASGDILYFDGTNNVSLGIGADGEVLTLASGLPTWASSAGDPLALKIASNLSELTATAGTARTNIGLGTTDTPEFYGATLTDSLIMKDAKNIQFFEMTTNGSDYVAIKAPDNLASTYNLTLPPDDGTPLQFLQTNGSGTLTWASPAGAGDLLSTNNLSELTPTAATARGNLGAAASGVNTDITGLIGLNTQNAIQIGPWGLGVGSTGEQRFLELAASGTNYVGFKAPDTLGGDQIWTLPTADGTNGQVLTTDGTGKLIWGASPVGGGTVTSIDVSGGTTGLAFSGGPITTVGTITMTGTLGIVNGGTNLTSYASGDILYASAVNTLSPLAKGTANQVLGMNAGATAPEYKTITAGTGISVTHAANSITIASTGGLTSLNGLSGASQTFATGTSGSDFGISSLGTTHTFNLPSASVSNRGLLTSADWTTFNNKGAGTVTTASVVSANGFGGSVSNPTTTPAITLTTSVTGLIKGNGSALSAATSGADYSAGTSGLGTGILKSTTGTGTLSIAGAEDFPILNQSTTGTASNVTGTVAVANGGTGQTTYTNGQLLIGNTTGSTLTKSTLTGTANQIIVTNGTGTITLSTPQNINTTSSPTFAGLNLTAPLTVANGGTGLSFGTSGGILGFTAAGTLASSGTLTANALIIGGGVGVTPSSIGTGSAGQILKSNGAGAPYWASIATIPGGTTTNSTLRYNGTDWVENVMFKTDAGVLTGVSSIDNTSTGSMNIGATMTSGDITIGGTAQTGTLSMGNGAGAQILNFGAGGGGVKTIGIGGTAANVIKIGNYQTAGSISLGAAMTTGTISIGGTGAQTGTIGIGTGTGAQTLNLGTGGTGAKTVTLGSTAGTSMTYIQAGTNGISLFSEVIGFYKSFTGQEDHIYIMPGINGGSVGANGILTTADLTAHQTYTLPNATGTILVSGTNGVILSSGSTPILKHQSVVGIPSTNVGGEAIGHNSCEDWAAITVSGLVIGDTVSATPEYNTGTINIETQNLSWNAYARPNNVMIRLCNPTAVSLITSTDQLWRVDIWKH